MKQLILSFLLIAFSFQVSLGQTDQGFASNNQSDTEQTWDIATPDDAVQILNNGNNAFLIVLSQPTPGAEIGVYDVLGNRVMQEQFGNRTKLDLNLTGERHGVYFVKISQPGKMITKRIVVK